MADSPTLRFSAEDIREADKFDARCVDDVFAQATVDAEWWERIERADPELVEAVGASCRLLLDTAADEKIGLDGTDFAKAAFTALAAVRGSRKDG